MTSTCHVCDAEDVPLRQGVCAACERRASEEEALLDDLLRFRPEGHHEEREDLPPLDDDPAWG